jgi:hypothetical protein
VRRAAETASGEKVAVRLADGSLECTVDEITESPAKYASWTGKDEDSGDGKSP